jgi:hypothetical protein
VITRPNSPRTHVSPSPVPETQSAFHPHAQRSAFLHGLIGWRVCDVVECFARNSDDGLRNCKVVHGLDREWKLLLRHPQPDERLGTDDFEIIESYCAWAEEAIDNICGELNRKAEGDALALSDNCELVGKRVGPAPI